MQSLVFLILSIMNNLSLSNKALGELRDQNLKGAVLESFPQSSFWKPSTDSLNGGWKGWIYRGFLLCVKGMMLVLGRRPQSQITALLTMGTHIPCVSSLPWVQCLDYWHLGWYPINCEVSCCFPFKPFFSSLSLSPLVDLVSYAMLTHLQETRI